jgi:hypothetical protein
MAQQVFVRARGVLGESAQITLSQVLFSIVSLLLTGAATRRFSAPMAAGLFAVYALQSTLVTFTRSYFYTAPLMRLPRRGLGHTEFAYAIKTLVLVATLATPVLWAVALWQGLDATSAVLVAVWAGVMALADVLRSMTFIFCRNVTWTLWAGGLFCLATFIGLTLLTGSSFMQLLGPPIVITAVFAIGLAARLHKDSTDITDHYWKEDRAFARSQAYEATGSASSAGVAGVLIARVSPLSSVSLQVAGQGVITPTLLIANGLSLPLTRRLRARQIDGTSGRGLIVVWAIAMVSLVAAATVFSLTVGRPIFSAFFGPSVWDRAAQILPYLAIFVLASTLAQVLVLPARATVPPAVIRRVVLVSVALSQATTVVAVAVWGSPGLAPGLAAATVVNLGVWVAAAQYLRRNRTV